MTLQHYYDGGLVTTSVVLSEETSGYSARAEIGQPETVRVVVDDPDGTDDYVGYKVWYMKETECATGAQIVWRGFVGRQRITRDPDAASGTARRWELDLIEDNGRLKRKLLRTSSADRPAETVSARIAWLLAEPTIQNTAHAFADHGLVQSSTVQLDAQDYNGRFPVDVLADCALASGYNFFIRWNETEGENELCFYDATRADIDVASAFGISNDPDTLDYATVWPPIVDPVLERDPSRIASGIYLPYDGGAHYATDSDTATEFGSAEQVAPTSSVKTASAAEALATRLLAQHDEQDEHLELELVLPAANLNDIRHGQVVSDVRLEHLPSFGTGRAARVTSKSFARPANLSQTHYLVKLVLVPTPCLPSIANYSVGTRRTSPNTDIQDFTFTPTAGNALLLLWISREDDELPTVQSGWTEVMTLSGVTWSAAIRVLWKPSSDGTESSYDSNNSSPTIMMTYLIEFENAGAATPEYILRDYNDGTGAGPTYSAHVITGSAITVPSRSLLVNLFAYSYDDVDAPGSIDPVWTDTNYPDSIFLRRDGDDTLAPQIAVTQRLIRTTTTTTPSLGFSLRTNDDKRATIVELAILAGCS